MTSGPDRTAATPLVSVVVLTFNRVQLLAETLKAILGQTYRNLELIVVDNMSADDTPGFLSAITDDRLRFLRNQNHGVLAINRNIGIRSARGTYIAFCDDDDVWLPEKLAQQVAALEATPEAALCFTNTLAVRDPADPGTRVFEKLTQERHFEKLVWTNFICNSSVLLRRSALDQAGLPDEDPSLTPYDDYDLWLRIAANNRLIGIDQPLVRYRVHPQSFGARFANRELIVARVLVGAARKLARRRMAFWCSAMLRRCKYVYSVLRHQMRAKSSA
jgi:glycosyltransferase involved in cell wall biosynthesis